MSRGTVFVVDGDGTDLRAIHEAVVGARFDCHCYEGCEELLRRLEPRRPQCFVVGEGVDAALDVHRRLRERWSEPTVVVLCGPDDGVPDAVRALRAGAFDVLANPCDPPALVDCVQRALQHDRARERCQRHREELRARLATLTRRQREVLECVVRGKANKVTAMELDLAEKTVEIHRSHMMKRMGARSISDLIRMWLEIHGS